MPKQDDVRRALAITKAVKLRDEAGAIALLGIEEPDKRPLPDHVELAFAFAALLGGRYTIEELDDLLAHAHELRQ